jgi:hypothetical protein
MYGIEVIFNGTTSLLNGMEITNWFKSYSEGTQTDEHRQNGDLISLTFLLKESRQKFSTLSLDDCHCLAQRINEVCFLASWLFEHCNSWNRMLLL